MLSGVVMHYQGSVPRETFLFPWDYIYYVHFFKNLAQTFLARKDTDEQEKIDLHGKGPPHP